MPGLPADGAPVAEVTPAEPNPSASTAFAALVALGLGVVAAVMVIAGHPPWEGRTVVTLTQTHGLHIGDVVGLIPLAASAWLARWCWKNGPRA